MRGYHIRIVVQRKAEISQSHPPIVDTFIPKSIFEHLPSQSAKSTSRRNAVFNPAHKDYRLGPIRVDWIDFENMSVYARKTNENVRGTYLQRFSSGPDSSKCSGDRACHRNVRSTSSYQVWIHQLAGGGCPRLPRLR